MILGRLGNGGKREQGTLEFLALFVTGMLVMAGVDRKVRVKF